MLGSEGEIMLVGWLVLSSFSMSLSINLSASSILTAWPWCCTLVGRPIVPICRSLASVCGRIGAFNGFSGSGGLGFEGPELGLGGGFPGR